MKFLSYDTNFKTWTVWTAGLLVKDAITLRFIDTVGAVFTVKVMVNYSARGYGRMTRQEHYYLDDRMLDKHNRYFYEAVKYSNFHVFPLLDNMIGEDFKSVNHFIKEYNKRKHV